MSTTESFKEEKKGLLHKLLKMLEKLMQRPNLHQRRDLALLAIRL